MRLRLTVRRHGLPDTPIIWVVDTSSSPSPTISQLLEAVNDAVPIESDNDWGLEDYAVELKGANGANYECLHFQHVAAVMKEDDEVIIRPLLTQDLKIRRVSGRRQISAAGGHLFDGLPFGRPLLRRPADRPPISIPPRKKRRTQYNDEDEEDNKDSGNVPALMQQEYEDTDDDANKQLVIHADFENEDSEDDEDFVPGEEDDDEEMDLDAEDNLEVDLAETDGDVETIEGNEEPADEQTKNFGDNRGAQNSRNKDMEQSPGSSHAAGLADNDESALQGVPEPQQIKIRKLHAAFPDSTMAVCKYVLKGSNGDTGEAYEALARGFQPAKSKSSFSGSLEDTPNLHIPRTRSKAKTPPIAQVDKEELMNVDDEDLPDSIVRKYDQGGLPPGSIKSGKALKFMAEALRNSPGRPRSARRSTSIVSNKSVRFAPDEGMPNGTQSLSTGLTSTPFIDQQSCAIKSESSDESESDESSEADTSSSDDSGDSDSDDDSSDSSIYKKEGGPDNGPPSANESSSGSSSDSSSEDSSSEEEPEEISSKTLSTSHTLVNSSSPSISTAAKSKQSPAAPPGQGSQATRKRNERRRMANLLDRYKKKGILPAGTTISELTKLDLDNKTAPDVVFAALQELRKSKSENAGNIESGGFERRRQELLDSLAAGGVDVDRPDLIGTKSASGQNAQLTSAPVKAAVDTSVPVSAAVAPEQIRPPIADPSVHSTMDVDDERPSTAPEAPKVDAPIVSPKLQPASAEPSQSAAQRSKIDLGAGRRLLFGALGMKAPRTKNDEEKLRADLMKNVRPLVAPKVSDPAEAQAEDEDEDPDAWKEKIVYRAVECVQEGIELSEPPFPFVQRWDPQQQRSWPQNGKRKQSQHEYPGPSRPSKKQKRRKGKHNYNEEQEYLDASYEPSYQDDSIQLQYDDSTQFTGIEDDHVDDEISLQLMNDIASSNSAVSQDPEDCIPLPEDPSTLPHLKEGDAKIGMIIAFKMLDCSSETQWQPLVSAYRTAVVVGIQEDGVYNLSLAIRDRKRPEKHYDENSGKRIYGKFETVDDDDDENIPDDGSLDLGYRELIEPKILQDPPKDYTDDVEVDEVSKMPEQSADDSTTSGQQDSAKAHLSHVTEIQLNSDSPAMVSDGPESQVIESIEDPVEKTIEPQIPSQVEIITENEIDGNSKASGAASIEESVCTTSKAAPPAAVAVESTPQSKSVVSDQSDHETAKAHITDLMKDTDFRTDPPSSVLRERQPEMMQTPGEAAALEKLLKDMTETSEKAYSPKFNGLGSSPTRKLGGASPTQSENGEVQVADSSPTRKRKASSQPPEENHISTSTKKLPQSSWETVDPQYQSPTPSPTRQADSSWITEDSQVQSSPPTAESVKAAPIFKHLTRKVPVGRAQALWEALQSKHKRISPESDVESNKDSIGFDGTDDKDSVASVPYPKLPAGSSFTSLIADHGRQPDFEFDGDDSMDIGTSKAAEFSADSTHNLSPEPERNLSASPAMTPSFLKDAPVESESELEATHKIVDGNSAKGKGKEHDELGNSALQRILAKSSNEKSSVVASPEPDRTSPDSDNFPTLEALSQSATIKRELPREKSTKSSSHSKADLPVSRPRQTIDSSEDENQTTPKAAQKSCSQSQSSKARTYEKPRSQSRTTAPRASQPIPAGSQVYDLTVSSDAEPEPQPAPVSPELDIRAARFRRYDIDSEDEDEEEQDGGWVAKKSSAAEASSRRQTGGNLKTSSQASLNAKKQRKTNAR